MFHLLPVPRGGGGGGGGVGMIILIFLPNIVIRSSFNCSNIANMDTERIKLVLMPLQVFRKLCLLHNIIIHNE